MLNVTVTNGGISQAFTPNVTSGCLGWHALLAGGALPGQAPDRLRLRIAMYFHVKASVTFDQTANRWAPSALYLALEPTEKGFSSYRVGTTLASVACERQLGIYNLTHSAIMLGLVSGKRGDLVGFDLGGQWHGVEAKGRTTSPSAKLITDAKTQAATLVGPLTNAGYATGPDHWASVSVAADPGPLYVELDDPPSESSGEPEEGDSTTLGERLHRGFYQVVQDLREAASDQGLHAAAGADGGGSGRELRFFQLPETDLEVGVDQRLFQAFEEETLEEVVPLIVAEDVEAATPPGRWRRSGLEVGRATDR